MQARRLRYKLPTGFLQVGVDGQATLSYNSTNYKAGRVHTPPALHICYLMCASIE